MMKKRCLLTVRIIITSLFLFLFLFSNLPSRPIQLTSNKSISNHPIDQGTPSIIANYTNYLADARDIGIIGEYAFVLDRNEGIEVFNISNPLNSHNISHFDIEDTSYSIECFNNRLYLASRSGLVIYDGLNFITNNILGSFDDGGTIHDVAVKNDIIFTADTSDGLEIINASNPTNPQKITEFDPGLGEAWTVEYSPYFPNFIFLGYVNGGGLQVINITDLSNPTVVSSFQESTGFWDIEVENDNLYAACNTDGVYVCDISNINYVVENVHYTEGYSDCSSLSIHDDLLLISNGINGLSIFNLAIYGDPLFNQNFSGDHLEVQATFWYNGAILVASETHGFCILDSGFDSDGDSLSNVQEYYFYFTNPYSEDSDEDGLLDKDEVVSYQTDPRKVDSDGDGLGDGDEILVYNTYPLIIDSDGDGLSDGDEILVYNTNPLDTDSDGDTLSDFEEINIYRTNPASVDSDYDGFSDQNDSYPNSFLRPTGLILGGVAIILSLSIILTRKWNQKKWFTEKSGIQAKMDAIYQFIKNHDYAKAQELLEKLELQSQKNHLDEFTNILKNQKAMVEQLLAQNSSNGTSIGQNDLNSFIDSLDAEFSSWISQEHSKDGKKLE